MSNAARAIGASGGISGKNCPTCGAPARQRSDAAHKFVFKAIARAFENWPEGYDFQPRDPEHLRAYLLLRIGHRHESELPIGAMKPEAAARLLVAFVRTIHAHGTAVQKGSRVIAMWPRSMAYRELGRAEFQKVSQAICEEIKAIVGVDAETLVKGAEQAA